MDILGVGIKGKTAAVEICEYALQPFYELFALCLFDYAAFPEHRRMGYRASDILSIHPCVKGYRRIEVIYSRVGF